MLRDSKSRPAAIRLWLLLAATLALAACSAGLKLGYTYADTVVTHSIDGYVGLTPEQEQFVKERTAALMAWHRATQLRDYAQLIEATRARLAGPVTATDVLVFNQAVNARIAALGDRAAPDLARLALMLTPDQTSKMQRKLAGDNTKARRELVQLAGKEALDERVQKYAERAEFWFGSLTREQLDIVRATLAKRPDSTGWWLDERERRQREFVAVLQRIQAERPDELTAAGWIRACFAQMQSPFDPARRAAIEQSRAGNAELVTQLVNAATAEQKAALSRKLGGFAEDLIALASARAKLPPG